MTQKIKICTKCLKVLPATTEFFYYLKTQYNGKTYNDGLRYQCKKCMGEYKRKHRKHIIKQRKEYYKNVIRLDKDKDNNYHLLHNRVKRLKFIQKYCSICNQEKKLELSSINGIYSEDPNDYWWLCHECHHLYDRTNKTHKKEGEKL